jgi:PAS domain S-box-containing protein
MKNRSSFIAYSKDSGTNAACLHAYLLSANDLTWSVDRSLHVLSSNDAYRRTIDALKQASGESSEVLVHTFTGEEEADWQLYYGRAFAGEEFAVEIAVQAAQQEYFFEVSFEPVSEHGGIIAVDCCSRDITTRIACQSQIREGRANLDALINSTADAIWSVGPDYRLITANDAYISRTRQLTGVSQSPGDYVLLQQYGAKLLAEIRGYYDHALNNESIRASVEYQADGVPAYYRESYNPFFKEGRVVQVTCFSHNVTKQRSAEMEVRESEANLKAIINNTDSSICSIGRDYRIISFNIAFGDFIFAATGVRIEKGGYVFRQVEDKAQNEEWKVDIDRALDGEQFKVLKVYIVGGRDREFEVAFNPIRKDDEVIGVGCFARDVSDERANNKKINEAAYRQSAILNSLQANIALLNESGTIIDVNDGWRTFATGNQLAGSSYGIGENYIRISEAADGEDAIAGKAIAQGILDVLSGDRQEFHLDYPCHTATEKRWFSATVTPLYRGRGDVVVAHFDITQDILAQEQLRRSASELADAQKLAKVGNWNIDFASQKLTWSDELYHIFGVDRTTFDLNYHAFVALLDTAYRQAESDITRQAFIDGEPFDLEYAITTPSGERRIVHELGYGQFDSAGTVTSLFGTAQDITERKEAENDIRALNESLERKVKDRTADLEVANTDMEAFNYTVAHDLRTPLRVISGYAQILVSDKAAILDEDGQDYLHIIMSNALLMSSLIDHLLEFSRLGRVVIAPAHCDMSALVSAAVEKIQHIEKDSHTRVIIHPLLDARCDPDLIRQVWINLISNAFKYSSKNERPRIEIGSEYMGSEICYYIKDNGAGFDMKFAHKLFGVFQRLHHVDEFKGSGVGLASIQRIIMRHGGRIWAESKVNHGATFYFTLPHVAEY